MKYAIAINKNGMEEYMQETHGDDCFTDDIGCAMLFDFMGEIPPLASEDEYIVKVNDEDGLEVISLERPKDIVTTEQPNEVTAVGG